MEGHHCGNAQDYPRYVFRPSPPPLLTWLGFRVVEKYGMLVGGVDAHRYDLSSMVMLKDNHIWSKGSITQAVHAAKSVAGFSLLIHVECQSLAEAREAIAAGADIIMLDNFSPKELAAAARELREDSVKAGGGKVGAGKRCLVEVSGGLTEENMEESLCPGTSPSPSCLPTDLRSDVDILSTSSIHQGVSTVDFSLKIQPKSKVPASSLPSLISTGTGELNAAVDSILARAS